MSYIISAFILVEINKNITLDIINNAFRETFIELGHDREESFLYNIKNIKKLECDRGDWYIYGGSFNWGGGDIFTEAAEIISSKLKDYNHPKVISINYDHELCYPEDSKTPIESKIFTGGMPLIEFKGKKRREYFTNNNNGC